MSSVICHGCGQAFALPEGYSRNKIQCPGCGVICQVPADADRRAAPAAPPRSEEPQEVRRPARSVEDDAAAWLNEPAPPRPKPRDPGPAPVERYEPVLAAEEVPLAEPEPAPIPVAKGKPQEPTVRCRHCGRPVRRQYECPVCDADLDKPLPVDPEDGAKPAPASASAPVVGLAPRSLELDDEEEEVIPAAADDEEAEDPSPYETADRDKPRCPKCRKEMEVGAVVCLSCGFNLRTRKKAKRTYAPVHRFWETDMTLTTRLAILGGVMAFHLLLTLGGLAAGSVAPFLAAGVPLLLILCFVLGTYDTTRIVRDERGRVTLTKQWRFFFVPAPEEKTDCRGYMGVLAGGWNDSGIMEWVICILLLCVGLVPAIVWWYVAIYQNHYHVSLAEDHGRAAVTVYRGRSEEQMHEIAGVLTDATGLRLLT